MSKILIKVECLSAANNTFETNSIYYNTGLNGAYPITTELAPTITCTPFVMAPNTVLEAYCALDNTGAGVKRTVKFIDNNTRFYYDDKADISCSGLCDLTLSYIGQTATSGPGQTDGKINVGASSSKPPIDCYIAGIGNGAPTTITKLTPAGVLPAYYDFEYANVRPGTYAARLQDNGNCQLPSTSVTVLTGNAPGVGVPGQPANITWFKYEYVLPQPSNPLFGQIHQGKIQGYAWDKTTKQGYFVPAFELSFPYFAEFAPGYNKGEIIGYVRSGETVIRYYRALRDMARAMFISNSGKLPYPDENGLQQGWWERLHDGVHDNVQPQDIAYFNPSPFLINNNPLFYRNYEQYQVVRTDYAEFYEAKNVIKGYDWRLQQIPAPGNKVDNQYWTYLPKYSFFHYVAPESGPGSIIDQYTIGTTNTTVRFHGYDHFLPNYVPTTSRYFKNTDNDYILFDDTIPTIEAVRGDLLIVDVIKNDVDVQGAENGSVAVLATSPSPPIKFHLRNGVRTGYVQDNYTGIYENLSPGHYEVDVYDAVGRYAHVEFDITDGYRERWNLTFDDYSSNPLELRIFQRDWMGGVTPVSGDDSPVRLSWDSQTDIGEYVPEAIGAILDFSLRTEVVSQFLDTASYDDRYNRVDYYRGGKLQFRGYINSTLYSEPLLGPGQFVRMSATCGLGQLKDTKFINFFTERQTARTSMLSILLKCLSFCDVNLPVVCSLNLRDKLMTANGDPLLEAYVHRNAYDKTDVTSTKFQDDSDIADCRTVVDAILRLFNATMFQADGCWKIISLSEADDLTTAFRVWSPAGTQLTGAALTGIDTSITPLRILPEYDATGANELYWVNSSQVRNYVSGAEYSSATVKPVLETNLLDNGYFVEWDATNARPLYWSVVGKPTIARAKGEKVHEFALKFSDYTQAYNPNDYVLSPGIPHLPYPDEDSILLKFKALLEATVQTTAELIVTAYFQVICDGVPYGDPITVDVSTKDKWKEFTAYLPLGMPGRSVRLRVLNPVATDAISVNTTLKFNYIALSIQPGQYDWEDYKQESEYTPNPNTQFTGIILDDLDIVHADLPLLPNSAGNPLPPFKMDVYAWRHAISLEDYTATIEWKRPKDINAYTMLKMVANDRMELRVRPLREISGTVSGLGINRLRVGLMLDIPNSDDPTDDGKYLLLQVDKKERLWEADITAIRIADGYYDGAVLELPDGVRIAKVNGKLGYRVATDQAGDEGYRIAAK